MGRFAGRSAEAESGHPLRVAHADGAVHQRQFDRLRLALVPGGAPASVSQSATRCNDGQKLELEGDYKWSDCFLGTQIELWPLAGFRFQRFDMTAYDGLQLVNDGTIRAFRRWAPPFRCGRQQPFAQSAVLHRLRRCSASPVVSSASAGRRSCWHCNSMSGPRGATPPMTTSFEDG